MRPAHRNRVVAAVVPVAVPVVGEDFLVGGQDAGDEDVISHLVLAQRRRISYGSKT